jgi:uncharacterized membrane protein YgcG
MTERVTQGGVLETEFERGMRLGMERAQEILLQLDDGVFFSSIEEVWSSTEIVYLGDFKGSFNYIRRKDRYYTTVVKYNKIIEDMTAKMNSTMNAKMNAVNKISPVQAVLQDMRLDVGEDEDEDDSDENRAASKKRKNNRKPASQTKPSVAAEESSNGSTSASASASTSGKSANGSSRPPQAKPRNNRSGGGSAARGSKRSNTSHTSVNSAVGGSRGTGSNSNGADGGGAAGGSNRSSSSAANNPSFTGSVPSSRAHMVPESNCRFPYGVYLQAVYGESSDDKKFLRELADKTVDLDLNLLRAPGVHGELFDTNPCWILVPICDRDFIKNWNPEERYDVLAIAGGFTRVGVAITKETANKGLCTHPYHMEKYIQAGKAHPLSRCSKQDIEVATSRLSETVLALADTLFVADGAVSPIDLEERGTDTEDMTTLLEKTRKSIENSGVVLPLAPKNFDDNLQVLKCSIDPKHTDLIPDPMLLLMKAAINWSWRCGQKLLPACGSVHSDNEEARSLTAPYTPIPKFVEVVPAVTPDDDDDDDDYDW